MPYFHVITPSATAISFQSIRTYAVYTALSVVTLARPFPFLIYSFICRTITLFNRLGSTPSTDVLVFAFSCFCKSSFSSQRGGFSETNPKTHWNTWP